MATTYNKLSRRAACIAVVATAFAGTAQAQTPKAGDPSTPTAATSLRYRSVLDRYQRYREQPVQSWRDANDNVGRIGGWRTYAKEAAAPEEKSDAADRAPDPLPGHPRGTQ